MLKTESKHNPEELILTIKDNSKPKGNIIYQSTIPVFIDDEYDYVDGKWELKPNDCYNSIAEWCQALKGFHNSG